MFKTCQCSVHVLFNNDNNYVTHTYVGHNKLLINLIFASRKLAMCSKIEHNIIEAITIKCCEY